MKKPKTILRREQSMIDAPTPNPTLEKLLELARKHIMTPEEVKAQRQSWVRGELAMGTDADEEKWKEEHGY